MNFRLVFILIHLIAFTSFAGVGGTGGGNLPKPKYQLITVHACNGGESGQDCYTIRYYDRPKSKNFEPECLIYHGETMIPCPITNNKNGYISSFLAFFRDQGIQPKIWVENY